MLCILQKDTNPFFNIASEEYFLKNFSDDICIIYRNSPSVIVGKHQNTLAEVDYRYAQANGISIVRRLSGGGSVYHDLGNVNFTFIRNGKDGALVDFKGFTMPIVKALARIGVEATFEGQNSLYVKGKKISGNAEHIFKQRVMHHGTLLYSTNQQTLANVLYVDLDRYSDKAVKSVRAKTTNLIDHLITPLTVEEFVDFLFEQMLVGFQDAKVYEFLDEDIEVVKALVGSKYSTWEWNFGYSPTYSFSREIFSSLGSIYLDVEVDKGLVKKIAIHSEALPIEIQNQLVNSLTGCIHKPTEISNILNLMEVEPNFKEDLLRNLF
jgi:lipoate---protein ligase